MLRLQEIPPVRVKKVLEIQWRKQDVLDRHFDTVEVHEVIAQRANESQRDWLDGLKTDTALVPQHLPTELALSGACRDLPQVQADHVEGLVAVLAADQLTTSPAGEAEVLVGISLGV